MISQDRLIAGLLAGLLLLLPAGGVGGAALQNSSQGESPADRLNPRFSSLEYFRQHLATSSAALDLPQDRALIPEWREKAAKRLFEVLGLNNCESAPLNPVVTDLGRRDGYRLQRVVYTSEPYMDVPGLLLIPDGVSAANPAPAILCLHGNVPGAKDELAGETAGNPRAAQGLELYQDDYARDLARQGFVTFAIDLRDAGEREPAEPYPGPPVLTRETDMPGEDWRQISGLMAIPLGRTFLGLSVWDALRALDYLETRPEVKKGAIGCIGFSAGATLTAWVAALDRRVKVAGVSGTSIGTRRGLLDSYHRRRPAGVIPSFLLDLDSDLCVAAIAPTPLVLARDRSEGSVNPLSGTGRIRRVYEALGAEADLKIDYGPVIGHVWHREVVVPWFVERLRAVERSARGSSR